MGMQPQVQSHTTTPNSEPVLTTASGNIDYTVLGKPGWDNAAYVYVNNGQSAGRYLFDCGASCLDSLDYADLQQIDAVFFSHLHFDHIAGFDGLMRATFNREEPLHVYGPEQTAAIIQHRLQGVLWDRVEGSAGSVIVHELSGGVETTYQYMLSEKYSVAHPQGEVEMSEKQFRSDKLAHFQAIELDHGSPSIGYHMRELSKINIDMESAREMDLPAGPWIQKLKSAAVPDDATLQIDNETYQIGDLRERLLQTTEGGSLAYITDFSLDEAKASELVTMLYGVDVLICENNFADEHAENAKRHHHLTTSEVAELAARINPGKLVMFHISDRYPDQTLRENLETVQKRCPNTTYPAHWYRDLGLSEQ